MEKKQTKQTSKQTNEPLWKETPNWQKDRQADG